MSKQEDGGPMFPHDMTLRDWFAGQALSGLATESDMQRDLRDRYGQEKIYDVYAECAYRLADAMLAARTTSPAIQQPPENGDYCIHRGTCPYSRDCVPSPTGADSGTVTFPDEQKEKVNP